MEFELNEYNVRPSSVGDKECILIVYEDGVLYYNNKVVDDKNKIDAICNLIKGYKDEIIRLDAKKAQNYLGGHQQIFRVEFEEDEYSSIVGNTSDKEVADFYSKIKNEIINIIEQ